ncbi:Vps54-like protein-domain-containing protein [Sphaerosporella brunnea]|uniref:Vps54-like protein-domain-containing protein n=1 Tax=Sphaerosporella brunnea TaxID=1250544 RepID=A0A5J5ERS2_9PEZI|nr:Vps54-like protein-domain-containing protein [Sphaerosporella brunnea]
MASPSRPSIDSSARLSPILSPTASATELSSVHPPRSGSAHPGKPRRASTASSVFSLTSSVGTALDWRTSKEFGGAGGGSNLAGGFPNSTAISTLVEANGPRAAGAARPRPGEIPPVTLSQIPKVKPSAFASYLSIAPEYDRYQRAKDQGLEEHLRLSKTTEGALSPAPSIAEQTVIGDDNASIMSGKRRGRRASLPVAPLQSVPQVYFDENFRLENPRTFDVVSERSEVLRPTAPGKENGPEVSEHQSQRKALATNAILQEKLSWYMDTVEVHLISSISTASSSFFAALGDLRELHSEATTSVQKIQALRKELVQLDEEQAVKGLEIVRLRRRRNNVAKLERAVKQIERVTLSVQKAEKSLEHHEIDVALDTIFETERLLAGEGEGLIDLRGVRSLEAVTSDLNHLRFRIGKAYEAHFVQCLLDDLRHHIERVPSSETLRRFGQSFQREQYQRFLSNMQQNNFYPPLRSSSLPPEYTILSESLRTLLMKHLDGLQKANHVNEAVQAYRDAVIKEAKNLIRRNLPSEGDADSVASNISHMSRISKSGGARRSSADKSQSLTRALRALGPADAEDLLVKIYTGTSELIRRLGAQQKMLLDVTMQMGETGVGGMLSPRLEQNGFINGDITRSRSESDPTISMDISDLISSAVEIAQSNITKVVKVRTEQVARYPSDMFIRYYTLNRLFIQECEAVSVRVGSGLHTAVSNQIREFLNVYQEEKIRTLVEGLEKDKWAAKEFEAERQNGVNRILKAATRDPEEWVEIGRLWEIRARENGETIKLPPPPSESDEATTNGTNSAPPAPADDAQKKLTHAVVDGQKFILPESGLLVLTEVEAYLRLAINIPGVTQELGTNILQFLQLFNSRTFQLILGAGATRSAGLKSITTKHLAMASQALSIIATIIPYIRETLRRQSSSPNLTADFDKLKRTTQEYQDEIHGKLISIMSDRARSHVSTMKKANWDEQWVGEEGRYYMDILCRETGVLYKVLNKHLPISQVAAIMGPVFRDYAAKLVEGFSEGMVRTDEGKNRMIRDAETFRTRLGGLEGYGNTGEIIMEAVRNKMVTPLIIGSPPPRPSGNGMLGI